MNTILLQVANSPDHSYNSEIYHAGVMPSYLIQPLILLIFIIIVIALISAKEELSNHWNYLLQNFSYSTKEFYQKLGDNILNQGVSDITVYEKNIATGGVGSGKRIYLQIQWREYRYDVCAAPFGDSFFISYWGVTKPNRIAHVLSKIPLIGKGLVSLFFPTTYYKVDADTMFHTLIHACVTDLVNEIAEEKKLPLLTETEATPVMKDIFAR